MTMRPIRDFLFASEDRFMRILYTYIAFFACALIVTACSTDLHGVNVSVVRKQPDVGTPIVVTPPASPPVGGS